MNLEDIIRSQAGRAGLSDLHLHEGRAAAVRVNGDIETLADTPVSAEALDAFFDRHLNGTLRQRFEAQGDADLAIAIDGQRYRASFARGLRGRAAILRRLEASIPEPEALGLPPALLAVTRQENGLVLVTGPTGSGKSTSLASLIGRINRDRPAHILTVEDPIEYIHDDRQSVVFQREVGRDASSFAQALRAALREDPDVILVGEMRDLETVSLALTAAETGHLVFATLHTSGAPNTINRIIDVFPSEQQGQVRAQLAQSLRLVCTQRLCRRVGGGRVAAFEIMVCNHAVRNLIREGRIHQIESAMQTGRGEGMMTMESSLAELAQRGLIERPLDRENC